MRRWLVLSLGLGLALVAAGMAGWALLTADPLQPRDPRAVPPDERALDEIDPASRERLEDILREAEREDAGGASGDESRRGSGSRKTGKEGERS